ncbi:MAG TPA: hypothetical protein ENN07_02495 [candidate division Zixibacteria bacterium]|nr:hypothetical protein [candidate division Zixibacteria bacterium]
MKRTIVLIIIILAVVFSACNEQSEEVEQPKPPVLSGEITISFDFPSTEFTVGEAICIGITVNNGLSEEIAMKDFPAKRLELFDSAGEPVFRFQRAAHPTPPRMFLRPGEDSYSMVDLSGAFENFGPGLLSTGEYTLKATMTYYRGEDIRFRQRLLEKTQETSFTVLAPSGDAAKALDEAISALGGENAMSELIGISRISLDESVQAKLDEIAEKYPFTPLGSRILVNHLGVWYQNVPLERYRKLLFETEPDCPCCLHAHIIARLIRRYVIVSERNDILDIAEEALKRFPPESEVGVMVRQAFGFRMEGDAIIR